MKVLIVLASCLVACLAEPIPVPFKWNESFRVFYDKLDEQHKGLFKAIYDLELHPTQAIVYAHLKTVMAKHFRFEEEMMKEAIFVDLVSHKGKHEEFETTLRASQVPISSEKVAYAKHWLVDHIKLIDFKYKGKLHE